MRFTGGEGGAGGAQAMLRETDVSVTCCIGGALSRRATVGLFAQTERQAFLLWSIHAASHKAGQNQARHCFNKRYGALLRCTACMQGGQSGTV